MICEKPARRFWRPINYQNRVQIEDTNVKYIHQCSPQHSLPVDMGNRHFLNDHAVKPEIRNRLNLCLEIADCVPKSQPNKRDFKTQNCRQPDLFNILTTSRHCIVTTLTNHSHPRSHESAIDKKVRPQANYYTEGFGIQPHRARPAQGPQAVL